jgi:hypothetical protein
MTSEEKASLANKIMVVTLGVALLATAENSLEDKVQALLTTSIMLTAEFGEKFGFARCSATTAAIVHLTSGVTPFVHNIRTLTAAFMLHKKFFGDEEPQVQDPQEPEAPHQA